MIRLSAEEMAKEEPYNDAGERGEWVWLAVEVGVAFRRMYVKLHDSMLLNIESLHGSTYPLLLPPLTPH